MLSDGNKRAVYDQFGEEGLKGSRGGGAPPGASAGPGFASFGFPGGVGSTSTFTFTSSGGGGFSGRFNPTDPNQIFEYVPFTLSTHSFNTHTLCRTLERCSVPAGCVTSSKTTTTRPCSTASRVHSEQVPVGRHPPRGPTRNRRLTKSPARSMSRLRSSTLARRNVSK